MANTFLLERQINIGKSMVELDKTEIVKNIIKEANENNCKIILTCFEFP